MSEKTFWHCTPRKLNALLSVHGYFNGSNSDEKENNKPEELVFIDEVSNF